MSASTLEKKLKEIVRNHPHVVLHEYCPTGPYVRAVLWRDRKGLLRGQVVWDTGVTPARWVVRSYLETDPDAPVVVENPSSEGQIPEAITEVMRRALSYR